jgi:hypothetical protein
MAFVLVPPSNAVAFCWKLEESGFEVRNGEFRIMIAIDKGQQPYWVLNVQF